MKIKRQRNPDENVRTKKEQYKWKKMYPERDSITVQKSSRRVDTETERQTDKIEKNLTELEQMEAADVLR